MKPTSVPRTVQVAVSAMPLLILAAVAIGFSLVSPQFLTAGNLASVLVQSSWLVVVALGMNMVLLTGGVDLSVGAAMYLAAVVIGTALGAAPVWVCLLAAILTGFALGAVNGFFVVKLQLPAFIATLASTFVVQGLGLYLSETKIVFASTAIADLGRGSSFGVPTPLIFAVAALCVSWVLLRATTFGLSVRSIGADTEGARRAGVPVQTIRWWVYALCGAFGGFGGFISLSQISAASSAFGQNAEFLAIAAAVLGGTSLFGGRGTLFAPVIGAILIMTVQNGLAVINANPYAYPVITGAVIFLAVLLDTVRSGFLGRLERRGAATLMQQAG